jgi:hypothetical protein
MKIDWRAVSHIGAAIVGTVVPGVVQVEDMAWKLGTLRGAEKQDAVVQMVRGALAAANTLTERQLAEDPDVERATRDVIDAVVALQKMIAKRAAVVAPSA